jgi:hypothetical protein
VSTTPTQTHTYTTPETLTAAMAACVTPGQIANVVSDATRPAVVGVAKFLDVYTGHSRDPRATLDAVVVAAYAAANPAAPVDDTPDATPDTADAIVALVDGGPPLPADPAPTPPGRLCPPTTTRTPASDIAAARCPTPLSSRWRRGPPYGRKNARGVSTNAVRSSTRRRRWAPAPWTP